MIKKLSIEGFRGYSQKQTIFFSLPSGENGSGLNIIVGPNNSGKSTIVESINAFNGPCSFSEGKRNANVSTGVCLELWDENDNAYFIKTKASGGSEVDRTANQFSRNSFLRNYVLPSRRFVEYEFGKSIGSRESFIQSNAFNNRKASLNMFSFRLFSMLDNKDKINELLSFVVDDIVDWTIEQHDNGNYYVKFTFGGLSHSSEGVGDGMWSILTICDALYDSDKTQTIVIDEPELSIHPLYQKRIMELFLRYSKDRQIIVCTHSPYFVDWKAISNGASLIRTNKTKDGSISINQISQVFRENVNQFLNDVNNPHVLGIESNEVFFVRDNIVLTEGQEDVVAFNRINNELSLDINGIFFGWGAGGASKETIILKLFQDLGFKKVVSIFDGDKKEEYERCKEAYPNYHFYILPCDDVRDKKERHINAKQGLSRTDMSLKDGFKEWYIGFIDEINKAFEQ